MNDVKPILQSRTVWANLVGIGCLVASVVGVETRLIDQGALTEALLQVATGASFLASTVFRVGASKRLAP